MKKIVNKSIRLQQIKAMKVDKLNMKKAAENNQDKEAINKERRILPEAFLETKRKYLVCVCFLLKNIICVRKIKNKKQ